MESAKKVKSKPKSETEANSVKDVKNKKMLSSKKFKLYEVILKTESRNDQISLMQAMNISRDEMGAYLDMKLEKLKCRLEKLEENKKESEDFIKLFRRKAVL